jgi:hypothetical protein
VPPDFEETTNSVRRTSIAARMAPTAPASVESSTRSRGLPAGAGSERLNTSGASEEPPMPSTTTSSIPSSRTPSANASSSSTSTSIRRAIVSQPSRFAISGIPGAPHSVASPSRRRSATPCSRARASAAATPGLSASGTRACTVSFCSPTIGRS